MICYEKYQSYPRLQGNRTISGNNEAHCDERQQDKWGTRFIEASPLTKNLGGTVSREPLEEETRYMNPVFVERRSQSKRFCIDLRLPKVLTVCDRWVFSVLLDGIYLTSSYTTTKDLDMQDLITKCPWSISSSRRAAYFRTGRSRGQRCVSFFFFDKW